MNKIEINSLNLQESKDFMKDIGEKPFRGEQVFSYFNRNRKLEINELNLLPQNLIIKLNDLVKVNQIDLLKRFDSKLDKTNKYLFQLGDGNIIESVFMEYKHGNTACISTQVGCKMGCAFCASTKAGLIRHLSPAEMVNQIYMMEKDKGAEISNIVLMGSGEPLDNYDNLLKFIDIIHDEKGHNLSLRNITISTCGLVPKIYDLAKENLPITLSISLHSPFDEDRMKIMPIAKKYKLKDLLEACKYYGDSNNRRITFEYTLIDGVNDGEREANELSRILRGINAHINLIPLNPIKEYNKKRPERSNVENFQKMLLNKRLAVTIRREMGSDISASCGQLRRSVKENS